MSGKTDPREWIEKIIQAGSPELASSEHAWMADLRSDARDAVKHLPVPHRKQETWRYSWVDSIFAETFQPASNRINALQAEDIEQWVYSTGEAYRFVVANGRMINELSQQADLPAGVTIGSLTEILAKDPESLSAWFGEVAAHEQDVFTALNTALAHDGLFIHLENGVQLEKPVEIMHISLSVEEPQLISPRHLYILGKKSGIRLIEHFRSTGDSGYFYNAISEIYVDDDADFHHHRDQSQSRNAFHLHKSFLALSENSQYRYSGIATGGKWARDELQVNFRKQHAQCHTNVLSVVGSGQLSDFHLDVQHATPENGSYHNCKSVVHGNGHMVFDGRILVEKDAQKTDAHLNNKNLLLDRNGEVDTKPQLEIYADDVKCSHGTTVGQLDPLHVYYLRSRGIPQAHAIKMLCQGFAGEIINTIGLPAVQEQVNRDIMQILSNIDIEVA